MDVLSQPGEARVTSNTDFGETPNWTGEVLADGQPVLPAEVETSDQVKGSRETREPTCGTPVPPRNAERLPVQTVERLHRAVGGDALVEAMILRFIAARYGARSLIYLPANVAKAAVKRPADFLRAAKDFCEPELQF